MADIRGIYLKFCDTEPVLIRDVIDFQTDPVKYIITHKGEDGGIETSIFYRVRIVSCTQLFYT